MAEHLTAASTRAARAILRWSAKDLCREASVSATTLGRAEKDERISPAAAAKLIATFAAHGVEVLPPPADGARRMPPD